MATPTYLLDIPTRTQRRKSPGRTGNTGRRTPTAHRFMRSNEEWDEPRGSKKSPRVSIRPYDDPREWVYDQDASPMPGRARRGKGYALVSDFKGNECYITRKLFGSRKDATDYCQRTYKSRPVGNMNKRVYRRSS